MVDYKAIAARAKTNHDAADQQARAASAAHQAALAEGHRNLDLHAGRALSSAREAFRAHGLALQVQEDLSKSPHSVALYFEGELLVVPGEQPSRRPKSYVTTVTCFGEMFTITTREHSGGNGQTATVPTSEIDEELAKYIEAAAGDCWANSSSRLA